jgi:hypothetical protein
MSLSSEPIREFTSREIASIISSILGGLLNYTSVDQIILALNHFQEHRDGYIKSLYELKEAMEFQNLKQKIEKGKYELPKS